MNRFHYNENGRKVVLEMNNTEFFRSALASILEAGIIPPMEEAEIPEPEKKESGGFGLPSLWGNNGSSE